MRSIKCTNTGMRCYAAGSFFERLGGGAAVPPLCAAILAAILRSYLGMSFALKAATESALSHVSSSRPQSTHRTLYSVPPLAVSRALTSPRATLA